MKKASQKNRLKRTLKIADIDDFKTLGRCPFSTGQGIIGELYVKRVAAFFAVVGDLLVRDVDVVKVFQGLCGFAQGKTEVDMEEKRLSVGENFASQTLQRSCPLEPLFL